MYVFYEYCNKLIKDRSILIADACCLKCALASEVFSDLAIRIVECAAISIN